MGLLGPPNERHVKKLMAQRNVEGLFKVLSYENSRWSYKDRKWVKIAAINALAEVGGEQAVEPIAVFLNDGDEALRRVAARALGSIGGPLAIKALITELTNEKTRRFCLEGLIKVGAPAVEPLIPVLQGRSDREAVAAAFVLGEIRDTRAVEPLLSTLDLCLGNCNTAWGPKIGVAVARSLAKIGDRKAVQSLKNALKSKDADMFEVAASALEKVGWEPDCGEDGAYYWVAKRDWKRAISLGSYAIEPLIAVLGDDGYDWSVRQAAADALGKIGAASVGPLIAALTKASQLWYCSGSRARKLGRGNVWLYPDMHPRTLDLCASVVKQIGRNDTIDQQHFIIGLNSDKRVRDFTLWALKELGYNLDEGEIGAWYHGFRDTGDRE